MEKLIIATALLAAGFVNAETTFKETKAPEVKRPLSSVVTKSTNGITTIIKTNTWGVGGTDNDPTVAHKTNSSQVFVDTKNKINNVGTILGGNQVIVETKVNADPKNTDPSRGTSDLKDASGNVVGVKIHKIEVQDGQVLSTSIYRVFTNPKVTADKLGY